MSDVDSTAVFRTLPDFPYYRFGSDGSVWSRHGRGASREHGEWRRLSPAIEDAGYGVKYYVVALCNCGEITQKRLHQWMAVAFYGPCPDGMEVCHNDGNGLNCRPDNLRYDTRKGNMADTLVHGTRNHGDRNGRSKIEPDDVRAIRHRASLGESYESIADDYPICRSQIRRIVERKKWKHVA